MARLRAAWVPALVAALWNGCSTPRDSSRAVTPSADATSRGGTDSGAPSEVEIGRVRDGVIIRGRTTPPTVRPGSERAAFLAAAARALEVNVDSLDLGAPIIARYGADELQVYECVQRAEDIWRVQLLPPRIPLQEFQAGSSRSLPWPQSLPPPKLRRRTVGVDSTDVHPPSSSP